MKTTLAVAVMAKAPLPGLAKTRLIPALGAEGAAALAQRLLDHAVAQAVAAAVGPVTLWCTPEETHPSFHALRLRHGIKLAQQQGADLGQRMHHIFEQATGPLLLMGTDLPGLNAEMIREAAMRLGDHDAVFVPAVDGGYGLVGLHRPCASLFENMRWSTPQVMAQTRARLARAGLRHSELPALQDIDEPDDLIHLGADWRAAMQILEKPQ